MKFPDLLAMSLNNLRRRKLRTSLTILGVVVGTASIVVMISLGIGMKESNQELIESYGSLTSIEVYADMYGSSDANTEPNFLNDDAVKRLMQIPHVTAVYPMLEVNVLMRQGAYEGNMYLTGVPREIMEQIPLGQGKLPDPDSKELEFIYGNAIIHWFWNAKSNRGFGDSGELADIDFMGTPMSVVFDMDKYYQAESGQGSMPKKYLIKAAGVVEGSADDYNMYSYSVYADLDLLKEQLTQIFRKNPIPGQPTNRKGKPYPYLVYSSARVDVDDMEYVTEVQQQLTNQGYQAHSNIEWLEQTQQQTNMTQAVLGGIGAISLFVAAIGIANTMMMSIYERTKEIGIIKVLGCDMKVIRDMFLIESGFIGFMGGVIGVVFSFAVSLAMNNVAAFGEAMSGMGGMGGMGAELAGDISRIPPQLALAAIAFAIVIGMIAGFFPAVMAMKLSPLAAIRSE